MIGQTRLVTNGSKFSYSNNQPLETENIVGVHNGIFANLEEKILKKRETMKALMLVLFYFMRIFQNL